MNNRVSKPSAEGSAAARVGRRDPIEASPISDRAAQPPVPMGDARLMQQLLSTFANSEGTLNRRFETKTAEGHFATLQSYRQLVAAIGASIGTIAEGAPVDNGQGVQFKIIKKARVSTDCEITMTPEAFMRISAAYGFNAESKIDSKDQAKWSEIKTAAAAAKAEAPAAVIDR